MVWALTNLSEPDPPMFGFAGEEKYAIPRFNINAPTVNDMLRDAWEREQRYTKIHSHPAFDNNQF